MEKNPQEHGSGHIELVGKILCLEPGIKIVKSFSGPEGALVQLNGIFLLNYFNMLFFNTDQKLTYDMIFSLEMVII